MGQAPGLWEIYDALRGIPQARYVAHGYATTANLSVPKAKFETLSGFDPSRLSGGAAEFCRRARRQPPFKARTDGPRRVGQQHGQGNLPQKLPKRLTKQDQQQRRGCRKQDQANPARQTAAIAAQRGHYRPSFLHRMRFICFMERVAHLRISPIRVPTV